MIRLFALVLAFGLSAGPAAAQSAEEAQMRLYIQQLEERVRQLTGENEQLTYQLNQLRGQAGQTGQAGQAQLGAAAGQDPATARATPVQPWTDPGLAGANAVPPGSVAADDPLI